MICQSNDGAGVGRGEEGEDELRRVGEEEHDGVSLTEAEFGEAGGELSCSELCFFVGVDGVCGAVNEASPRTELRNVLEAIRM